MELHLLTLPPKAFTPNGTYGPFSDVYRCDFYQKFRKKETGCYFGNYFVGPPGRADDTVSMAPSVQGLQITDDIRVDLQGSWTQYYTMVVEVI